MERQKNDNLTVTFKDMDKSLSFPDDVIFPHQFLEEILKNLNSDKKILVRNVYEGTIPEKFFRISVFFTDEINSLEDIELPEDITNQFRKVRMAYYQDKDQTPIFEQTIMLNDQGIAGSFKYDYPDYSLFLKLKKINLVPNECK